MPHLLLCLAFLNAVPARGEVPVVGRPAEHFYGAVGEHVRIVMHATPTRIRVEDPILLTIAISGADNPGAIERPDLRSLPDYLSRFYIDDLPGAESPSDSRVFRYRLRPKNERVAAIPPLLFHYYDPKLKYFATTAPAEPLPLTVTPRNPPTPSANDPFVAGPGWLFEPPPDHKTLSDAHRFHFGASALAFILALALPAIGFGIWLVLWRRLNPDAAKLAGLRRAHAVRSALDDLRRAAALPPDQAGERVSGILRAFLKERLALPARCATAGEIGSFLDDAHLPAELSARIVAFFRECDLARFGPPGASPDGLASTAENLILEVEAAQ